MCKEEKILKTYLGIEIPWILLVFLILLHLRFHAAHANFFFIEISSFCRFRRRESFYETIFRNIHKIAIICGWQMEERWMDPRICVVLFACKREMPSSSPHT